jgi:hypothetical protein
MRVDYRHEKAAVVSHFVEPDIDECARFSVLFQFNPGPRRTIKN